MSSYSETLENFSNLGQLRNLRTLPQAGSKIEIEGRNYLNFSSNDYLSLSQDERVKRAAAEAVFKWGTSASASRLVTGDLGIHAELERELASYMGQESALVFGSGFLTNLGVLGSLAGRSDQIFSDKLNHASLIDGGRHSQAQVWRYKHKNMTDLRRMMKGTPSSGEKIIVTESIFSMDGDIAPLEDIFELANEFDCIVVVDEAHAVGPFGPGIFSKIKGQPKRLVIVGTLSKSLASYGGFVACSEEMRNYFINTARSFIYSTGLPPSCCAAGLAALKIIREEPELGEKLISKAKLLHAKISGFKTSVINFESQIVPIVVNDNKRSVQVADALYQKGIICSAIRPPSVPQDSARLRLSVNLAHTEEDLLQVAEEIGNLLGP